MQFQVPQFIESEDKLVGPFTLRQFIYIGAAGAVSAMLYFSIGGLISVFVGFLLVGAAAAFGFIKVGGRPLLDVFLAAFNFYWKPQTYIWRSEHASSAKSSGESHQVSAIANSIERIAAGSALHSGWASLQTGSKISDRELIERKMESRYQIFHHQAGDRTAAKRIDYR